MHSRRSLVMRRPLVADHDSPTALRFTLRLARHQHLRAPRHQCQVAFLAGDNVAEVLNRADEVGDLFFEGVNAAVHTPHVGQKRSACNPRRPCPA